MAWALIQMNWTAQIVPRKTIQNSDVKCITCSFSRGFVGVFGIGNVPPAPTYQGDIHSVGGTRVRSKTSDSCDHLSTRIRCGESLLPVGRVVLEHHTAGADE